jgi:uncharacterized protein YkwD
MHTPLRAVLRLLSAACVCTIGSAAWAQEAAVGTCVRSHDPLALTTFVDPNQLDGRLLDHAVRVETNQRRCEAGLASLGPSDALSLEATRHAVALAEGRAVAHQSTEVGRETSERRATKAGFVYASAENVAWYPWMDFPDTGFTADPTLGSCGYRNAQGQPIPPMTYARLAERVVGAWMGSPGHREAILFDRTEAVGVGVSFDAGAPHCGNVHVVQLFGG